MSLVDVNKVIKDAEAEVREELEAEVKEKIKSKLKELDRARKVVNNLEHQLEVLKRDMGG